MISESDLSSFSATFLGLIVTSTESRGQTFILGIY